MDISKLLSRPHDMNPGSAAPYLEAFAAQMALVGHTSWTISFYLGSAIHFGGWLEAKGLDFADIDEETIKVSEHTCVCQLDWPLLMLSFGPTWPLFRLPSQTQFLDPLP